MTRTLWCDYAWLGGSEPARGVRVEIEDGRFTSVTSDALPGDAERRTGLTLPGFANGHSHAFHRALRGRTHHHRGDFWSWRKEMYRLAARLDPSAYFRLARATFSEMVMAGYTTVGEFHYLHHGPAGRPYADPNEMGRTLIAAARDAGIRITLIDTCYLHGGFDTPLDVVQRRFGDGSVEAWSERVARLSDEKGVRIGAAVHSVRACTPTEIAKVAEYALDMPLHAHVSEQPAENEGCLSAFGSTPTAVFSEAGALERNFTAVHATHLTDDDRRLLGDSRTIACICPSTERDLADGMCETIPLVDSGVRLSLGSDSNAVIDAFDEARSLEFHERLRTLRRGNLGIEQQMSALTNHAALGWDDAGSISVGHRADLVTIDLDSVRLAGSDISTMLAGTIHTASPADIATVTVDGIDRVTDRTYVAGDIGREFSDLIPRLFA
ncbi:MAG: formimidoylglutamate deiminase [Acidimicrobiia bacterium]